MIDAARALGHIPEDKANPARWKGHLELLLPKRAKLTHGHHPAMPYADVPAFVASLRASEHGGPRHGVPHPDRHPLQRDARDAMG